MADTFTLTFNNTNSPAMGGTKASEREYLADQLAIVIQQLQSGAKTSNANHKDRGGKDIGSWTWTPVASS